MTDNEKELRNARRAECAAWAKKETLPVGSAQRMAALVEWTRTYNWLKEIESVVGVERSLAPRE